tara:strand:+ start:2365 stop:2670 length:306 start_codon:yes stop_codon:yes gene_type:complete
MKPLSLAAAAATLVGLIIAGWLTLNGHFETVADAADFKKEVHCKIERLQLSNARSDLLYWTKMKLSFPSDAEIRNAYEKAKTEEQKYTNAVAECDKLWRGR